MDGFKLEPGLGIDLIASESLVVDPLALAFDENKRLYVIEDPVIPRGTPNMIIYQGRRPLTVGGRSNFRSVKTFVVDVVLKAAYRVGYIRILDDLNCLNENECPDGENKIV